MHTVFTCLGLAMMVLGPVIVVSKTCSREVMSRDSYAVRVFGVHGLVILVSLLVHGYGPLALFIATLLTTHWSVRRQYTAGISNKWRALWGALPIIGLLYAVYLLALSSKLLPVKPTTSEPNSETQQSGWIARSYVVRHWRGEMNLGLSFWMNGLMANALIIAAGVALGKLVGDYDPVPSFIATVAYWIVHALAALWQMVGIWRSANHHVEHGGRKGWAVAAKVMVVLGASACANVLVKNCFPQVKETYDIAVGDPHLPPYTLRLLNQGNEVEFSGGIRFGAAKELKDLLDAAPQISVVHLNSLGGRVAEAERMRNLFRERRLVTYTSDICVSACSIAFVGGVERFINPMGRIGFHQARSPGIGFAILRADNERLKREAVLFGVDAGFAEKAFSIASDDLWFATVQELVDGRYATAVSTGQFTVSGWGPSPTRETVITKLKALPLYDAMASAAPETFDKVVSQILGGVLAGKTESEVYRPVNEMLREVAIRLLPKASDDAIFTVAGVLLDEIDAINSKDPLACYAFLFPQNGDYVDIGRYAGRELMTRDLNATEMVFRSGVSLVAQPRADGDVKSLYDTLYRNIAAKYPQQVVATVVRLAGQNARKEEICAATSVLYKEALALGPPNDVRLVRHMMTSGRKRGADN